MIASKPYENVPTETNVVGLSNKRSKPAFMIGTAGMALANARAENYKLLITTQICECCGREHKMSQLMICLADPESSIKARHETLAKDIRYNLPIVATGYATYKTPACHECFDTIKVDHLPEHPSIIAYNTTKEENLAKREALLKLYGHQGETGARIRAKTPPTLDELA